MVELDLQQNARFSNLEEERTNPTGLPILGNPVFNNVPDNPLMQRKEPVQEIIDIGETPDPEFAQNEWIKGILVQS